MRAAIRRPLVQAISLLRGLTAANGATPIQKLQAKGMTTGETRDGVLLMQQYGFASRPHAGCDYVGVTLDQRPDQTIIIASNDQRWTIVLSEGEAAIFDDLGQKVHLQRTGITVLDKSQNSIVTTPAGVLVTDKSGSTFTMADEGIALAPANKIVTVAGQLAAEGDGAGTGATVDGNLNVTGVIRATEDIVAGFGTADQVSLLAHLHTIAGGASQTGAPVPGT